MSFLSNLHLKSKSLEIKALREENQRYLRGWPPGHFYSPIPSLEDVARDEDRLFAPPPPTLEGVDLNVAGQLSLLEKLAPHYAGLRFADAPQPGLRYHYQNDYFTHGEAIILFCLIGHLQPARIIEVGSGFSSAVMLDATAQMPESGRRLTFIEPYPDRLNSLVWPGDLERTELLKMRVQDVDDAVFDTLGAGDILFVDSSHVAKVGSDVNHLVFHVLPRLRPGVFIHFHDIYYPFEYPKKWIDQGRAWNEAYLLRAFLQHNSAFAIEFFNSYLGRFHAGRMEAAMPLFIKSCGSSIWLSRR